MSSSHRRYLLQQARISIDAGCNRYICIALQEASFQHPDLHHSCAVLTSKIMWDLMGHGTLFEFVSAVHGTILTPSQADLARLAWIDKLLELNDELR